MANRKWLRALAAGSILASLTLQTVNAQNREPAEIDTIEATLERFARDYEKDPMASDITFGVEVDGHRWTVESKSENGARDVEVVRGFAEQPMIYFTTDRETLNLIEQKVWSPLTAMVAATSSDKTPLDLLATEGYERSVDYEVMTRRLIFHFWTKGFPEAAPIGVTHARVVHGAPATALYYDKDFRSAVYHVPGGLGREQAPTLAVPFPRMVIVLAGEAAGEAGETSFMAKAGEMVMMPPGIPVTFWNAREDETLSFVWLMWGDGA